MTFLLLLFAWWWQIVIVLGSLCLFQENKESEVLYESTKHHNIHVCLFRFADFVCTSLYERQYTKQVFKQINSIIIHIFKKTTFLINVKW